MSNAKNPNALDPPTRNRTASTGWRRLFAPERHPGWELSVAALLAFISTLGIYPVLCLAAAVATATYACHSTIAKGRWQYTIPFSIGSLILAVVMFFFTVPKPATIPAGHERTGGPEPTPQTKSSSKGFPGFKEQFSATEIVFGGNSIILPKDLPDGTRINLFDNYFAIKDDVPLTIYFADGDIKIDAELGDPDDPLIGPVLRIRANEFSLASSNYDRNWDDRAFEVINFSRKVIFRALYDTPHRIRIDGIFRVPQRGQFIVASAKGVIKTDGYPLDFMPVPLFQYPSWRYLGLRAHLSREGRLSP